jgi:hypothetical protein
MSRYIFFVRDMLTKADILRLKERIYILEERLSLSDKIIENMKRELKLVLAE